MTEWSDEARERLTELYGEGRSASVIADLLGREGLISVSRNAIIGKAHRLSLPPRRERKPAVMVRKTREEKQQRQNFLRRQKRAEQHTFKPKTHMDHDTRLKLRCEAIEPKHLTIYDLTDDTCRFPYGDDPPFTYCGHRTANGSYCLVHAARCFGSNG